MVSIDHAWDNLRLVREAKWKNPSGHPDIEAAHEALQLVEGFQELLRLPEIGKRPAGFQSLVQAGHGSAKELEQVLRPSRTGGIDANLAEKAYRKTNTACTQCHAKYRDGPVPAVSP